MARFVAAVVTVINGRIKAKADPRVTPMTDNASLALAVTVTEARRDRAGVDAVKRAGREAWRIHQERQEGER